MTTDRALTVQHQELALTPDEVVANATVQSKLLMDIVIKSHCYQQIHDKKYLQVEAWETIGAFNRVHAVTESITPIKDDGQTIGYQAKVNLYKDGLVVGGAEMPAFFTENCCKGKEGDAKHKAAMSAAQTFATSKAYRMNYSYVAILAGFEATPAEEITDVDPTQPDYTKHYCKEHKTAFFKKGKMPGYAHPIAGTNQWCNEPEDKPQPPPDAPKAPPEASKTSVSMITPAQLKAIQELIKTNKVTPAAIREFTKKQMAKELTEDEADKLLKAIQEGKLGKTLADTVKEIFPDAEEV